VWDGRNEHGESVGSGVYYYRLEAPGYEKTLKMTVLK
jgi:flagellar hook assembly protein FlgD